MAVHSTLASSPLILVTERGSSDVREKGTGFPPLIKAFEGKLFAGTTILSCCPIRRAGIILDV